MDVKHSKSRLLNQYLNLLPKMTVRYFERLIFSRYGPKTHFRLSKCRGSHDELGKFLYLGQIDLKFRHKNDQNGKFYIQLMKQNVP